MECNYVIEWYVDHPLSVGWHNKLSHPAGNINLALFSLDAHVAKKTLLLRFVWNCCLI